MRDRAGPVTGLRCSLDPMVAAQDRGNDGGHDSESATPDACDCVAFRRGRRDAGAADAPAPACDPAHALYEQAAGLLANAGALRAASHAPGSCSRARTNAGLS